MTLADILRKLESRRYLLDEVNYTKFKEPTTTLKRAGLTIRKDTEPKTKKITIEGEGLTQTDILSSTLSGKKEKRRKLKPGDTVEIRDYDAEARVEELEEIFRRQTEEGINITPTKARLILKARREPVQTEYGRRVHTTPNEMIILDSKWDGYYEYTVYLDLEKEHAYCGMPDGNVSFTEDYEDIAKIFETCDWGVTNGRYKVESKKVQKAKKKKKAPRKKK